MKKSYINRKKSTKIQNILFVITFCFIITITFICIITSAGMDNYAKESVLMEEVNQRAQNEMMSILKNHGLTNISSFSDTNDDEHDIIKKSYRIATLDQKELLNKAINDDPFKIHGGSIPKRDILIIMNELDEETPRISLNDVKNIISTYEFNEILSKINDIAGAPDAEFGNITTYYIYYTNDQKNEFICINALGVIQYVIINQDGSEQREIIYSHSNILTENTLNPLPTMEPKLSDIIFDHEEPIAAPLTPKND